MRTRRGEGPKKKGDATMAIAPELISPEPITDVRVFRRKVIETFNLGPLYIPDIGTVGVEIEDEDGLFRDLQRCLTAIGNERFEKELRDAWITSSVRGDFRHVLAVLGAWFRTMAFKHSEQYEAAAEWARTVSDDDVVESAVDAESLIAELGLEDSA